MPNRVERRNYLLTNNKKTMSTTNLQNAQTTGEGVEMEKELHFQIFEYCWSKGWILLPVSMSGQIDFVILADRGRTFIVKCMAKNGKLSSEQLAMKIHAEHLGHHPAVVHSMEKFFGMIYEPTD